MSKTIAEILGYSDDVNPAAGEKTASENTNQNKETSSIEKLAMNMGLLDEESVNSTSSQENKGHNKEASMTGMRDMYASMFPSDEDVIKGAEKVASANAEATEMEKEAAEVEFAIGERAFDHFETLVEGHITKMASVVEKEMERHDNEGQMQNNEVRDNKSPASKGDLNTGSDVMGTSPKGAVGTFENRSSPDGEVKHAAYKKAMLQYQINAAKGKEA